MIFWLTPKNPIDKRTFACYNNQAVFETAGAARHNGFYPPAEKRAFDCNAFKPFPGDGKGLFTV